MRTTRCRDLLAERRERAAACVDRHLQELTAMLSAAGLTHPIVEGSAVAAEVFLADTNTLHTAVRVALFASRGEIEPLQSALRPAGFQAAEPIGDLTLLRMASRNGRRPIHVLFEGDGVAELPPDAAALHPGDPDAARERARRLGTAWLDVLAAFRRVHHRSDDGHEVTESFEVQVIDRGVVQDD